MVTFFRRIRKELLGDGATSKYLLYAIGEIALVVIGILIALQINNWNEWSKEREIEKKTLEDLSINIERNIEILEKGSEVLVGQNRSSNIVLNTIGNQYGYIDTLDWHFWSASLRGIMQGLLTYDGYEAYKNVGFNIVQSDSIKKRIINLFEVVYKSEEELISNYRQATDYNPLWSKHFTAIRTDINLNIPSKNILQEQSNKGLQTPENLAYKLRIDYKPLDYASLLKDNDLHFAFQKIAFGRNWLLQTQMECLIESQKVLLLIKGELGEG